MEFTTDGRKFVLRGATTSLIKMVFISHKQRVLKYLSQPSAAQIFSIQVEEGEMENKEGKEPKEVVQIL